MWLRDKGIVLFRGGANTIYEYVKMNNPCLRRSRMTDNLLLVSDYPTFGKDFI